MTDREARGALVSEEQYQYRAVVEGLADVMGAAATRDWTIAGRDPRVDETVGDAPGNGTVAIDFRRLQRNIDGASSPLATAFAQEPHFAGGIVSNAAVEVQREMGWRPMARIFYGAIDDPRFSTTPTFSDVAALAISAADRQYGPQAAATVRAAFAHNGVQPSHRP